MDILQLRDCPVIEVRGFKWPRRPSSIALASLIGEDTFGKWIGVASGNPWWTVDGTKSGVFQQSFVKLFPENSFWTSCFLQGAVSIDVDISLPVRWVDGAVEEIDLELDVLYSASGGIAVRDREIFAHVRETFAMPPEIARQAEVACREVSSMIERREEPFGSVGFAWLSGFLQSIKQEA